MTDLFALLLRSLRGYVPVLLALLHRPKTTILARLYDRPDPLGDAMAFFGITLGLNLALQAPMLAPEDAFPTVAGSLLVAKTMTMLVFNGAVALLFRLLGGRGGLVATFCASLYIVSPAYLFIVFTTLLGLGIVAGIDPDLARALKSGTASLPEVHAILTGDAPGAAALLGLTSLLQFFGLVAWFLTCWGAYRAIHGVSRWRSALTYLAAWAIYYGAVRLGVTIQLGLHDGAPPPIL